MKPIPIIFPIHAVKEGISLSLGTFEQIISNAGYRGLIKVLLGLVIFWHLYVPVHELLHVAGCLLGGGQVTALALKPQYGGSILDKLFPFVVPESEYDRAVDRIYNAQRVGLCPGRFLPLQHKPFRYFADRLLPEKKDRISFGPGIHTDLCSVHVHTG